jgi:hypothetical protein
MEPRYIIFVETVTGEIVRAFTWSKDPDIGCNRARGEARDCNIPVARVWAEEVKIRENA